MRSGVLICLIVVVSCATAALPPAQISPGDILIVSAGDPNFPIGGDPNFTWDVPLHLTADWEYVTVSMSSQVYNPAVRPDAQATGPQWSLSVVSTVNIIDRNGLIAWSSSPTWAKAYDQDGQMVAETSRGSAFARSYQQPYSWTSSRIGDWFHLSFPVDPNVAYPTMFSKVEWGMNVLLVQETKTVDLPFEPNGTWVELTPGFEVMVEEATVEEGRYQYKIKVQYDTAKVDYLGGGSISLWGEETIPPAVVLSVKALNAVGQPVTDSSGGGFGASGSNNQMVGTISSSASCSTCGDAKTIQFTLGFNLYEQEVSFTLTDIPVPAF